MNMAVLLVCGVGEVGHSEVLAIKPMLEESASTCCEELITNLKDRDLHGRSSHGVKRASRADESH